VISYTNLLLAFPYLGLQCGPPYAQMSDHGGGVQQRNAIASKVLGSVATPQWPHFYGSIISMDEVSITPSVISRLDYTLVGLS